MVGNVTPYPLALIVCDAIWTDPYTGKSNLLGVFHAFECDRFPLKMPVICLYAGITDCQGKIDLRIELIDVNEEEPPILEFNEVKEVSDHNQVCELAFRAANVEFPQPGEYRLKLYANDQFLLERRLFATLR